MNSLVWQVYLPCFSTYYPWSLKNQMINQEAWPLLRETRLLYLQQILLLERDWLTKFCSSLLPQTHSTRSPQFHLRPTSGGCSSILALDCTAGRFSRKAGHLGTAKWARPVKEREKAKITKEIWPDTNHSLDLALHMQPQHLPKACLIRKWKSHQDPHVRLRNQWHHYGLRELKQQRR